jgi:cobalt-zinc-cadmium efflux system membrane fusion protein
MDRKANWPVVIGVGVVALGIGFAAAHWFMPMHSNPLDTAAKEDAPASHAEAAVVKIPAAYIASAQIVVEPVTTGSVGTDILAPATVAASPGGEATVVARASGTLARVDRRLGDAVHLGEVLARVDSMDAAAMAADRRATAAKADLARKNYAREADLFGQGVVARQDMEAVAAALAAAAADAERASVIATAAHVEGNGSIAVVSPISGRITAAGAMLGAFVEPQTELFRVTGSDAVQVEASITAADTFRIAAGDPATIVRSSGPPLLGTVHSVTPTVSSMTRAATVVVTPPPATGDLVIGEGVQVRLVAHGGGTDGLSIPEEAVQNLDGRDVLFVRTAEGFRAQPVLVGTRSGGMAQIISGIHAGERVATRNAFLVKAEMNKGAGDDE